MSENPDRRLILLAISTSRYSRHLVDHAMSEAERFHAQGNEVAIDVLYVIESQELDKVSNVVGNQGFLGLSPQQDVRQALGTEHHRVALRRVEEVRNAAEERGLEVTVTQAEGSFSSEVQSRAEARQYDTILLTRADRPFIARILFGSESDNVAKLVRERGLAHVIIDEDA